MSFFSRRQPSTAGAENQTVSYPAATTPGVNQPKTPTDPTWQEVVNIKTEVLKIWRITNQNALIAVPDTELGYFYSDESYVVVKTFNKQRKFLFDVFFWVGKQKAAKSNDPPVKFTELVASLGDKVIAHREVEGEESSYFKTLFKAFGVLQGACTTAFNPERPADYKKRLLHFKLNNAKTKVTVREVPISRQSLDSADVYILDMGTKMIQWNGSRCDEEERMAARKYIDNMLKQRKMKCTSEFCDEEDLFDDAEIYKAIGNSQVPKPAPKVAASKFEKKLLRLSDETKKLVLTPVYTGKLFRSGINPDDVTFVELAKLLMVYIGPGANENERNSVWRQADMYLEKIANAPNKAICVFQAGTPCDEFEEVWDDAKSTKA